MKVFLFGMAVWGFWLFATSDTRLRYCLQYDVPYSGVTIAQKPHDCEWSAAPLGEKNCSYEADVFTVQTRYIPAGQSYATNGGPYQRSDSPHQFVCINGGRWEMNDDPSVKPAVAVSWRKVNN